MWLLTQKEILRNVQTVSHCLQKSLHNNVIKGSSRKENKKPEQLIKIFLKDIFCLSSHFFFPVSWLVKYLNLCTVCLPKKSPFSFINSGVTLVILPRATEQEGLIPCLLVCCRLLTIFDSWATAKYSSGSWDTSFALSVDVFVLEFCKQGAMDGVEGGQNRLIQLSSKKLPLALEMGMNTLIGEESRSCICWWVLALLSYSLFCL